MGCPDLNFATWAYLNEEGVPVICSRKEANHWFLSGGGHRSQVRLDRIGGWNLGTRFCTFSLLPDGPPLFWQVCLWHENHEFRVGEQRFATKVDALEFHANIIWLFRTHGNRAPEVLEILYSKDSEDVDEDDPADWWKE
jgi:hypothetical protein